MPTIEGKGIKVRYQCTAYDGRYVSGGDIEEGKIQVKFGDNLEGILISEISETHAILAFVAGGSSTLVFAEFHKDNFFFTDINKSLYYKFPLNLTGGYEQYVTEPKGRAIKV